MCMCKRVTVLYILYMCVCVSRLNFFFCAYHRFVAADLQLQVGNGHIVAASYVATSFFLQLCGRLSHDVDSLTAQQLVCCITPKMNNVPCRVREKNCLAMPRVSDQYPDTSIFRWSYLGLHFWSITGTVDVELAQLYKN